MTKYKLAVALFVAAAVAGTPGPALAQQGEPVYRIHYFSDATKTVQVGIHHGDCTATGPVTHAYLEGETSAFYQYDIAGYCYQGLWLPVE